MHEAYRRTRKDGATGIDGRSAEEYGKNLEENLQSLLDRAKTGKYRAPPVRRVHIPKDRGETRPLGIPTFEDKVLQRAVAMVLEAVYEQYFLDCSYGFRPGRSAHQALDALNGTAVRMAGGWVVELDIRKYFDSIDHEQLRGVLSQRVRDGVVRNRTAKDRFRRALMKLREWCKRHRHAPLVVQQRALNAKLRGHYGYYGRIGNRARLWTFLYRATREWKRGLARRSQRPLFWKRMYQLLERFPLLTPAQARRA